MKSLVVFLLSLIITCTACAMPKTVLNTTHRIEVQKSIGNAICSATAVGKHTLLTAAHCDSESGLIKVDGELAVITNRVFDGYDHELMTITKTFKRYTYFVPAKIKVGQEVWVCGNPKGIPLMLRKGIFSGIFKTEVSILGEGVYNVHMYDTNTTGGDSGSAIFNKHGQIVDVLSVSYLDDGFHLMGAFELHFSEADLANIE